MNPFGCPEVLFSPGIVIGAGKPLQTNPVLDPKERNDKNDRPLESHKNRTLLGGMRWYYLASSFFGCKTTNRPCFLGPNGQNDKNDKNDKSQPGPKIKKNK